MHTHYDKQKNIKKDKLIMAFFINTVMILSFWTDMPGQTVQTHCLLLRLHHLDSLLYGRAK